MNSVVIFLAALACASAGVIVSPAAQIVQGPSTRTTVIGPDGSSIVSDTPGGSVVANGGVIATTAGVATPLVAAAPTLVASGPALVAAPNLLARSTVLTSAPAWAQVLAAPGLISGTTLVGGTVIAGPSGTITSAEPLGVPIATAVL